VIIIHGNQSSAVGSRHMTVSAMYVSYVYTYKYASVYVNHIEIYTIIVGAAKCDVFT
jgi:hypothetical protein